MAWTPFNFFKYDPETHDFSSTTFNIKQALNDNWDHIKVLIAELREKTLSAEDTPTKDSEAALSSGGAYAALAKKENVAEYVAGTMTADGWSREEKTYSFEETYPHSEYNIEIQLDGELATDEQTEAWGSANIAGNRSANIAIAKGEVPGADIPIIIKVVKI